jgi:hypothetical protein
MKAQELRIGNYVNISKKVNQMQLVNFVEIHYTEYFFENYEPIPLTEEWLINLGFEMINLSPINYKIYRLKDISFNVIKDSNIKLYDKIVYSEQYRHIESVHQLQNLYFALTNEELKIIEDEN